jgi:hypothetical protein
MSLDNKHPAGLDALNTNPPLDSHNEKGAVVRSDGSDLSSPVPEYDDLPDPDAGKSNEERAKLVCIPCLTAPTASPPATSH